MKLVLDTNVLVSGVLAEGLCRDLLIKHILPHDLVTSAELLDEFAETIRLKFHINAKELPIYSRILKHARLVTPAVLPAHACRDPDNDLVLGTALAGRAEIIITGDKDLLVLKKYQTIRIVSPRQFLETLGT